MKGKPIVGMIVTTMHEQEAYETNQHGGAVWFEPGDRGVVMDVDVPAVRAPRIFVVDNNGQATKIYPRGKNPVFACIDFVKDGQKHRCRLYYDDIVVLNPDTTYLSDLHLVVNDLRERIEAAKAAQAAKKAKVK